MFLTISGSPGLSHKIPVWPNTNPPFITVNETTLVNSVVGSLRLQNGNSLQITSETSYVSLKITNRGADFLEADIILNIKLDYDHVSCLFLKKMLFVLFSITEIIYYYLPYCKLLKVLYMFPTLYFIVIIIVNINASV